MPTRASLSAICRARAARPPRVEARPSRSAASSGSKPRPTMCTVSPAKVTEISQLLSQAMPQARAAVRSSCWMLTSPWSVKAHNSTP